MNCSLSYEDSELTEEVLELVDKLVTVATKRIVRAKQAVGTSEEALGLGDISALGYCILINRDATNFINVKTATGGTIFARINAGEFAAFRFGSGVTAPFVIADTAACQLDYLIIST